MNRRIELEKRIKAVLAIETESLDSKKK